MRTRTASLVALTACILALVVSGVGAQGGPGYSEAPSQPLPRAGGPLVGWFPVSVLSSTPGHSHELAPSVAYNSQAQEYLVVWHQALGSENYVYGQFVSRNGALNGPRFLVQGLTGINAAPDVAYNPVRNEYLVVFVYASSPQGIYGQRLDALGSPVGGAITFASDAAYSYSDPAVAHETDTGQYLVAWQKSQGTAFSGIETRSVSGDGTTLGSLIEITGQLANVWPAKPDVACTRTVDGCLVVWQRWYDSGLTDHEIHGQRIHMEGGAHLDGPFFAIHSSMEDEVEPAVAAIARTTGIGQYLVVCERNWGGTWIIAGQSVTDGGALDQFISIGYSNSVAPAVAGNENTQEYLVVWPSQAGTSVRAVTISTLGELDTPIRTMPPSQVPTALAVASGPRGDYLVTCQDYYAPYAVIDIYGALWGNHLFLPVVQRRS